MTGHSKGQIKCGHRTPYSLMALGRARGLLRGSVVMPSPPSFALGGWVEHVKCMVEEGLG